VPEVDALLNDSRSKLQPAERLAAYQGIAAQLNKDRPLIYLYHRDWLWAYSNKLSGLREVPDGLLRVTGLKLN
jgi:peptide/nickel transport system substrate-binding protein